MLVRELLYLPAIDGQHPQHCVIPAQCDGQHAAAAADIRQSCDWGIPGAVGLRLPKVCDVQDVLASNHATKKAVALRIRPHGTEMFEPTRELTVAV